MTTEQRQRFRALAELLWQSADTGRPIHIHRTAGKPEWVLAHQLHLYTPFEYGLAPEEDHFDTWYNNYMTISEGISPMRKVDCRSAWNAGVNHARNK